MTTHPQLAAMKARAGYVISVCDNCLCCNECEDPQQGCQQRDMASGTISPRQYGNGQWVVVVNYGDSRESARLRAIQLTNLINNNQSLIQCVAAIHAACQPDAPTVTGQTILDIINRELAQ